MGTKGDVPNYRGQGFCSSVLLLKYTCGMCYGRDLDHWAMSNVPCPLAVLGGEESKHGEESCALGSTGLSGQCCLYWHSWTSEG